MEIDYHPLAQRDVLEILRYYAAISDRLADEFHGELRMIIDRLPDNPLRFPPVGQGFRRANLHRFPYHVLYEAHPDRVRVTVVRHNRRDPRFGLDRV